MRRIALSFGIAAFSCLIGSAQAAGLDSSLKDGPPISYSWTGFYAGLNGGIGHFTGEVTDNGAEMLDMEGITVGVPGFAGIFGAQAGYNYQFGSAVVGIEGDISLTGYDEKKIYDENDDHEVRAAVDWLSTIRARIGLAHNNALVYATGGLAIAGVEYCGADTECVTDGDENLKWSGTQLGLAAGGGAEIMLSERVSLRGEYLYIQTERETRQYDVDEPHETVEFDTRIHLIRAGINLKF